MQESTDEWEIDFGPPPTAEEKRVIRRKVIFGLTVLTAAALIGGGIVQIVRMQCLADPACKAPKYEFHSNP